MAYKKVGEEHFQVFVTAREAKPEEKPVKITSPRRVQRLHYRVQGERVAYVQRASDGSMTYHISLAV